MDAAEDRMLEKWEQSGESAEAQPGPLLGGHRNGFPSCAAGLLARSRSESAFPLSSSAVALSGLAIMEHTAAGLHGILTRFPNPLRVQSWVKMLRNARFSFIFPSLSSLEKVKYRVLIQNVLTFCHTTLSIIIFINIKYKM